MLWHPALVIAKEITKILLISDPLLHQLSIFKKPSFNQFTNHSNVESSVWLNFSKLNFTGILKGIMVKELSKKPPVEMLIVLGCPHPGLCFPQLIDYM